MLKIIYNEYGVPIPDAKIAETINNALEQSKENDIMLHTSSVLVLRYVQVLIATKEIEKDALDFYIDEKKLVFEPSGAYDCYFGDFLIDQDWYNTLMLSIYKGN